jgi:hypothetical protein
MKKTLLLLLVSLASSMAESQTIWTNETKLKGFIGKSEVVMKLGVPYGGASQCFTIGEYYYVKMKKNIFLCSTNNDLGVEQIIETVNGKETGYFIFDDNWDKQPGQKVMGTWYTMDGRKSYNVALKVVGKGQY